MRNRAFLPLIEQVLMIAVFAIVSAVCLSGFTVAESISRETERKDGAVILAQNTAEELKATRFLAGEKTETFGKDLEPNAENVEFTVLTTPITENDPFLAGATVQVNHGNEELFAITVYWQEGLGQ